MGQIYNGGGKGGSGLTRRFDNQMTTRTRGSRTLGGSVGNGSYEKGQFYWGRGLERLVGKDSFIEQEVINNSFNFLCNLPFREYT
jgi:hypothetical protein